jgi:hypothetical protein
VKRYEYQTIKTFVARLDDAELVAQLNQMGDEGWNLVAAVPHERHGYSHEVHLLFSRLAVDAPYLARPVRSAQQT